MNKQLKIFSIPVILILLFLPTIFALNIITGYYDYNSPREVIYGENNLTIFKGNITYGNPSNGCLIGSCGQYKVGNNSYVLNSLAYNPATTGTNFSLNMWIRPNNTITDPMIFVKDTGGCAPADDGYIEAVTGQFHSGTKLTGHSFDVGSISDNNWYMITYTKNASGWGKFYVNSILLDQGTSTIADTSNNRWDFGASRCNSNDFSGKMDETGLFNVSLNQSDITTLYNNGNGLSQFNTISINLISPADNSNNTNIVVINCTASSVNANTLTNVSLWTNETGTWYLNSTQTASGSLTSSNQFVNTYSTNFSYTCQACNNINQCYFALNNRTVKVYPFIETSQTFDATTSMQNYETFSLNYTTTSATNPIINFFYNNTFYGADNIITRSDINNLRYITASKSLVVPFITTQTNKTFYWIFNRGLSSETNSTLYNQSIIPIAMDNCSVNKMVILNYTLLDEDTQIVLNNGFNLSTKITIYLFDPTYTTLIANLSFSSALNSTQICVNNLSSNGVYIDAVASYDGGIDYIQEFNNIQKQFINNSSPQLNIPLYDLLITRSTEFLVTFKDSNFLPENNVLVDVTRFYVEQGVYKSVEVSKTDTSGTTLVHLVLGDVLYNIIFKQNGVILAVLLNGRAKCNNIATGDCQISANSFSSNINVEDFRYNHGLAVLQTCDRVNRLITGIYSVNQSTSSVTMNVTELDNYNNQTTICSQTNSPTSSGVLYCSIPQAFGNITVISNIYNNGILSDSITCSIHPNPVDLYDPSVTILVIMIVVTMSMMFISDIRGIMLGCFIGLILSGILVFVNQGNIFSSLSAVTYFLIAGGIILWKVNQKEER